MTPGARVAAAIKVLDRHLAGEPAEKALTQWARSSRFAGSGDRAAVRDHVYDALRCRNSAAHWGGAAKGGRGLMLGLSRMGGTDTAALFSGQGHAPAPLSEAERSVPAAPQARDVLWDLPPWLCDVFAADLGDEAALVAEALRHRAPIFLRVNAARGTRGAAIAALAEDGVSAVEAEACDTALLVTDGARRVRGSSAFRDGLVELQDAHSQAVCAALPADPSQSVLDFCAGGGGKSLALAARGARVTAHDADPGRMTDIPARANRAGVTIAVTATPESTFDGVLCDVPCSGSGAWRRAPEAKWRLTEAQLAALAQTQLAILTRAQHHVAPGGWLAYVTCSVLARENAAVLAAFVDAAPDWHPSRDMRFLPGPAGDGMYVSILTRSSASG